jgi:hypothetical protein
MKRARILAALIFAVAWSISLIVIWRVIELHGWMAWFASAIALLLSVISAAIAGEHLVRMFDGGE